MATPVEVLSLDAGREKCSRETDIGEKTSFIKKHTNEKYTNFYFIFQTYLVMRGPISLLVKHLGIMNFF